MKNYLSLKIYYLFIFLLCITSILSALYIEHIINIIPCKLCLYQRVPYIVSIFVCFFGYNYYKNLFWIYLLIVIFIISTFLSGYHYGIEINIFEEFSGCTSNNLNITNKADLLNSLQNSIPNCKDINFQIFGMSLATINLIISIIISISSICLLVYEKNR